MSVELAAARPGRGYWIRIAGPTLATRSLSRRARRNAAGWVLDRVREVQPWFHGDFVILLEDGTRVTSGRGYRERLQRLLGKRL
jgi:hypothetical protein